MQTVQLLSCPYVVTALLLAGTAAAQDAVAPPPALGSQDRGNGFVEHGVAAPVSRARGVAATAGKDGAPVILVWLYDQRGCRSLLAVDATSGKSDEYKVPIPVPSTEDAPYANLLSSRNKFYSLFGNTFLEFDPVTRQFSFVGNDVNGMAMSMTEDQAGTVWAVNYPGSHLVAFRPDGAEPRLVKHGSINAESWPQYQRSLAVDRAGWVYAGIGNVRSQIAAFNPATKETRALVKDEDRRPGTGSVFLGTDGKVYGNPQANGPWFELFEGKATPVEKPSVAAVPIKTGSQEVVFRDFPDGRIIQDIDVPEKWVDIKDPKDGQVRHLTFDYKSEGSHIQSIMLGPDARVYGSTGHPLRVFAYDPAHDTMTNYGLGDENGHWNALALQRNHIFGAFYGGGVLYDYDPAKPWKYPAPTDSNPRVATPGDGAAICRPHALLAHPDGRHLIMTGTPGYGLTGGGMLIHNLDDAKTEVLTHADLIPEHSTFALEALPDGNLVGGTTIAPGTGGEAKAKEAELYVLDFPKRKVTFHAVVLPGATAITDLKLGPDGLVYGLATGPTFFVFDPKTTQLVHQETVAAYGSLAGGQAPRALLLGPDRKLYAYFSNAIVRIEPGTFKHTLLAVPPIAISVGIVFHERRFYFANGSRLWSWKMPE